MESVPYESLIGISYGLLAGSSVGAIVGLIALCAGTWLDRRLPVRSGVVVTMVGAVGIGIATGLFEPGRPNALRIATAAAIAGLLGAVGTNYGNQMATRLPRDRTATLVRGTPLSADALDAVDAVGQVTIRPTGSIREFDGYPPLPPALKTALENGAWRFPADLQLSALESRLEQRLQTEHDLAGVDVSIDDRGRATITAGPPVNDVATALEAGTRAVTVSGLLPTGIEPRDRVAIATPGATVQGDVLAVSDDTRSDVEHQPTAAGDQSSRSGRSGPSGGFDGGFGSLTVAVDSTAAGPLLETETTQIAVLPADSNHEFEAATLLERAGRPITTVEPAETPLDAATTLGVRYGEQWEFSAEPASDADEAFVVGPVSEVSK